MKVDVVEGTKYEEGQTLRPRVSSSSSSDVSQHTTSKVHKPRTATRCKPFDRISDSNAIACCEADDRDTDEPVRLLSVTAESLRDRPRNPYIYWTSARPALSQAHACCPASVRRYHIEV